MADDLTLGEIARGQQAVIQRLDRIDNKLEALGKQFVPREVYDRDLAETRRQVAQVEADLAEDVASRKADRRLIIGAVLSVVATIIVQILNSIPGSGLG